ncbi:hypothetical protein AT575_02170 [Streptococcus penaeicida]|uniref:Chorismate mutase domain-containing protein n=1 Tax=Streptococcus penaeicida TaxID=1765960 RepID=A0A2N8LDL6_9STRE|nr:chorismate mutase [Streptococcus penaeicida]PND48247.1 hypothetical protein AT575_02170 [Streptococcus penaeicida]
MDLKEIRPQIDAIDRQLVALMEKRMDLVQAVADYKKEHGLSVLDSGREKQVLDKVASHIQTKTYEETILESMQAIMDLSKAYQVKRMDLND